jgi:glycosyltransferase involved in cell wall biosynthesis
MKVSIICCTWNSATYLRESVESVLAQTYANIEYIFVDGGSTDGTLDLIASINRPIKVLNNIRGGVSCAMNAGIRAATGDIVAHLHSDDYYLHPDVVASVARLIERRGAGWCYGRIKRVVNGELLPEPYVAPSYTFGRLLRGNFIPHPATFVRRELMLRIGCFDESRKFAMDYDMWLKLAKIEDPVEIGESLSAFRVHEGSLSSSNQVEALKEDFQVRLAHCGRNPLRIAEHHLRFWVRKRRLLKRLRANSN